MHNQHLTGGRNDRNGCDVPVGIERHILVKAWIHGQRSVDHEPQRITVGRRLGDDFSSNIAASAWPILDHERLLEAD
jgi:hypothetical protein